MAVVALVADVARAAVVLILGAEDLVMWLVYVAGAGCHLIFSCDSHEFLIHH
jgi:hypothetical protein